MSPAYNRCVVGFTAMLLMWIAIDTDHNGASSMGDQSMIFLLVSWFFALFFLFDCVIRFAAWFPRINGWVIYDIILAVNLIVAALYIETKFAYIIQLGRILTLVRAMPELFILLKGLVAASRSVFFVVLSLLLAMYCFSIMMTQFLRDTEAGEIYFPDVLESMHTLFLHGTLLGSVADMAHEIRENGSGLAEAVFLFYVFISLVLIAIMLGVVCQILSTVAEAEKSGLEMLYMKERLLGIVSGLDIAQTDYLTRDDFTQCLTSAEFARELQNLDIDVVAMVDSFDFFCKDDKISIGKFLELALRLRTNRALTFNDMLLFQRSKHSPSTQPSSSEEETNNTESNNNTAEAVEPLRSGLLVPGI